MDKIKECLHCKCSHCLHFDICHRRRSICFVCQQLGDKNERRPGMAACGGYEEVHRL